MNEPLLLLRLEGPLQAWGTRSRWDVRDTAPEPTKSGVIGLLGGALGCERGDPELEALDAALRFGVRTEHAGRVLEDFQTVTDFLPTAGGGFRHSGVAVGTSLERIRANPDATPATILSPRFYLEDAAFLVGLWANPGAPPDLPARCAAALRSPRWPLFLGRKCCVATRPILEALTGDYESLEDALQRHPWSWLGSQAGPRAPQRPRTLTAYVEDPAGSLVRQDAVRINAARVYAFRAARPLGPFPTPLGQGDL